MSDVLVLCYHAVSEDWSAPISVTPDRLEAQVRTLLARGYRGTTFTEAVSQPPAGKRLAVTFDDAYRSVVELAKPILGELGVPATVFVPTGFAGTERPMAWPGISEWIGGAHEHELVPASWQELAELAAGGWEIGSHTRTHPRLPRLDDASLREELEDSRSDCEVRLGIPCRSIAYPYAECDARVASAAREAGYMTGCAMSRRTERRDPMLWPRVGVYERDHGLRLRLKTSPTVRATRLGAVSGIRIKLKRGPR